MSYTVEVNGKKITYGPYEERSKFSDEEGEAISREMVKHNFPDIYEERKDDLLFILNTAKLIDLGERYEALLGELPQTSFSKAGTHPRWVADEVYDNTYDREITQEDVIGFIDNAETLEDLVSDLDDYFELPEYRKEVEGLENNLN